ncbi:MAG TPA: class I SAM-dependent methyltransferase [Chloroflexota bacterium]|nr:class I SAM-dependent methyltransferase [Chloroflexota bacterium]
MDEQNAWRERYRQRRPEWRPATEVYAALVRGELRPEYQPQHQPERQPSTLLLDLGCGRGGLVEQLDHPLCQMVGVDPDWLSLHEHRLHLPRVVAQSERLPFRQDCFDLVFASWVLEHLEDPAAVFTAVSRILKPGGAFVFITPNGRHPLTAFNRALGRVGRWQGRLVEWLYGRAADDTFPTFYRANTSAQIGELCQKSGLILEALLLIPDPTYLAFNPATFRLMCLLEERLPPSRKLHLVGLARLSGR